MIHITVLSVNPARKEVPNRPPAPDRLEPLLPGVENPARADPSWPLGRSFWRCCDHLPLYRQSEIYARDGVELRGTFRRQLFETTSSLSVSGKESVPPGELFLAVAVGS